MKFKSWLKCICCIGAVCCVSALHADNGSVSAAKKPVIGVPLVTDSWKAYASYLSAVFDNGGIPMILEQDKSKIKEQVAKCDGFIFIGGKDLREEHAHAQAVPGTGKFLPPEREEYYWALAEEVVLHSSKPVLGICLGHQLINCVLGGSLYTDIPTYFPEHLEHKNVDPKLITVHEVLFEPGSPLREIYGTGQLCVNSYHHQCVKDLGKGLVCTAKARDGVIEGIAWHDLQEHFIMGVQWHPEKLYNKFYDQKHLFERLIREAAKNKQ